MTLETTISAILGAETWTQRVQLIRLVPQRHGTADYTSVYAAVARHLYLPHLAPDFAYVHEAPFYGQAHFFRAYGLAEQATSGFAQVSENNLARCLADRPETLLVFRTLLGLTKEEFAHTTVLVGAQLGLTPLSPSTIDTMERTGLSVARRTRGIGPGEMAKAGQQGLIAAKTIIEVMGGELFGAAPPGLQSKQQKPDTERGWESVRHYASEGVPLHVLLHQRHYGGAFRQVLDATSTKRGDLIEDGVEALFNERRISFVRTGSHNQADIAARFEVLVNPAPDFVVFDPLDNSLKAMIECKGTNNGGTARDKALRFGLLRAESIRLGGVPLIAVLGGIGWARINDALGPVVRDTDGRVFTLSTLNAMLEVAPFPGLLGAGMPDPAEIR